MSSINMSFMPADSPPGITPQDFRCPVIGCPETFSEIEAAYDHAFIHSSQTKPQRFPQSDRQKGTLDGTHRARLRQPQKAQKAKEMFNHFLYWLNKGTNPCSQESNTLRPNPREHIQTSPPGPPDGQKLAYGHPDKAYSPIRKSENEFRGHSEVRSVDSCSAELLQVPGPETPWPYLYVIDNVLRPQLDFVPDLVENSTTLLGYLQGAARDQPNLRFRDTILGTQSSHEILRSGFLTLGKIGSGSPATDKDTFLLQFLAFIVTPTMRGLPDKHGSNLSRNELSPANLKDSLTFHTCILSLMLVTHTHMIYRRSRGFSSLLLSTHLGTHSVRSMLVDPVMDELRMDEDEALTHGTMCGLDSNDNYDLYDTAAHMILVGSIYLSQPQFTAYRNAVILQSHAVLMEQNPDLNKNTIENIDILMITLLQAEDENVPVAIPLPLYQSTDDSQQNQGTTHEGSLYSPYFSSHGTLSTEQNPQQPPTQPDPQSSPPVQCMICHYIPPRASKDSGRENPRRHCKYKHKYADLEDRICPVCLKVFSRPDNALTHLRKMHPDERLESPGSNEGMNN